MAGYYPPAAFHFKVEFSDLEKNDNDTRFQSVSGLSVEYEVETYKEGGENRFEHVLPVRTKYSTLTLKRGLLAKDSKVFSWCNKAFKNREFKPSNVIITLLNEEHKPLKTWNVVQAWPKKWSVADLNAEQNGVLIENLELQFQYFTVE